MSTNPDTSPKAAADQPMRVPFFRPKKAISASIRKRAAADDEERQKEAKREDEKDSNDDGRGESDDESGSDDSDVLSDSAEPGARARVKLAEKRRRLRGRNFVHTTSKKRQRELDELVECSSPSEEGEDEPVVKFDPTVKFASSGTERVGPSDMGATARTEVDTDYGRDAQSQFERVQAILKKEREAAEKRAELEEEDRKKYGERAKKVREAQEAGTSKQPKIYKGMALYGAKEKEDTVKGNASSGLNRLGPIRATQYMRASVRWDYAPDICKDYKETGFCTFGDSCKFMHDRTDYKHGWEIERDWNEGKLKEAKEDEYLVSSEGEDGGSDGDGDKLPHSCHICREHFQNPVITKCKHYFCEQCALKHYQKSKKCAICGEKTDGVFNVAREIIAKMKARDEAKARMEEPLGSDEELPMEEEAELKTLPMAGEEEEREIPGSG